MAARIKRLRHDEETRARIKTSQLINRLTGHAFGEFVLESTQVKAIEILLRKTLPDLASVQVSGDEENPLHLIHKIERHIVRTSDSNS